MFSGPLLATRRAREQAELWEAAEACAARAAELSSGSGSPPGAVQGPAPWALHSRDEVSIAAAAAAAEVLLLPGRPAEVRQGRPLPAVSLGQETSLTDAPLLDELLPLLSASQCSRPHAPRMGTAGKRRGLSVPWVPSRAPALQHMCSCCWRPDAGTA